MFLPSGDAAPERGVGKDIMVIEVSPNWARISSRSSRLKAPPVEMAGAQPLPEEVKPFQEQEVIPLEERPEEVKLFEEQTVITSAAGPEQENVTEREAEDVTEAEPELEEVEEPKPEVVEQVLPQQIATMQQQSAAAQQESSGAEKKGGDTTDQSAYFGERSKVNPRTAFVGTAVVRFRISADGR